jgi:hypothetical protein
MKNDEVMGNLGEIERGSGCWRENGGELDLGVGIENRGK